MSRRPAFQFYPADWRKESGLLFCSMGARGLWIEMLCIMHEGEPYGHLTYRGKTLTSASLARLLGENPAAVKLWYKELEEHEVFSITDAGVPYSRRMVRDEVTREKRAAGGDAGKEHGAKGAEHGIKGGRPRSQTPVEGAPKGGNKPPSDAEQKPPPSTSSSSASSFEEGRSPKPTESTKPQKPEPVREKPPPGITSAELAFEYVCRAADWRAANDTQRQNGISILAGWLALGCTLELILEAIAKARQRDPSVTRTLKRFDSTVRGMRRDQLGGEPTEDDVRRITAGVASKLAASG